MDTLAVFRSRSEALKIFNLLKKNHIVCSTVSTPAKLGVGCGISVIFGSTSTEAVKALIVQSGVISFVGFFRR